MPTRNRRSDSAAAAAKASSAAALRSSASPNVSGSACTALCMLNGWAVGRSATLMVLAPLRRSRAQHARLKLTAGRLLAQQCLQFVARRLQLLQAAGRQAIQHNIGIGRLGRQRRAGALPPVPAPAGDARLIGPDDFARFRIALLIIADALERLVPAGKRQPAVAH